MGKKIAAIILAAGKGTRMESRKKNKVTTPFLNKPLIVYGVELMLKIASPVIVVVGAFQESVKEILKNYPVIYAYQKKRLGTGHATKIGLEVLKRITPPPSLVLVGYGDHMMLYDCATIKKLIDLHQKNQSAISLITFEYKNSDKLKYGRIIRDKNGFIINIVEQKDATLKQRLIKEVNPGFYCFDYFFLKKYIGLIDKSPISKEYYLTDLIKLAASDNYKIVGLKVPFEKVGIGINTRQELAWAEKLLKNKKKKKID